MIPMKRDLWLRIKRYQFENLVPTRKRDHLAAAFGSTDASTRAFAGKLSRKLGWSGGFAQRAINEYRKFVYLGITSDFSVTPPKVIDQVWHEHLLFSRGYREFCRDVLERDFDHTPELVPDAQQTAQFEAQYESTLALYAHEFNVAPPVAFWGIPKFRSDRATAKKKRGGSTHPDGGFGPNDDLPLYLYFDGSGGVDTHHQLAEFGGGGGFFGGGAGNDWGGDASSSDAGGDSGGDSGGGDGGGSGCSSGCGGD